MKNIVVLAVSPKSSRIADKNRQIEIFKMK